MAQSEVVFFVYSESAQGERVPAALPDVVEGQRLNLMGVLAMMRPLFIPGQFSFNVNMALRGIDFDQRNNVRFVFRRGEQTIAETPELPLVVDDKAERTLAPDEAHFIMTLGFSNVLLSDEGWYQTDVFFNGELLGSYRIPVRRAQRT